MGEVRTRADGQMEFRDAENPEWTLAAYHSQYRRQFLDEAAEQGGFVYEPARGEAADDETSFEVEQQTWGPSKEDWHNITNSGGRKVMFDLDKPASHRPPQEPGNWFHDGYVLLDSKNHAVKDWPGLNKTLLTEIESWRWEALMRVHPWLTVADTGERKGEILPPQTPQAFTNRAYRFRIPNQIPASNPKNGSNAYKQEIPKNLAKENADSTEELPVLNLDQVQKVKKVNKGKFTHNSRYVVKKAEGSTQAPPSSTKRKAYCHDDDGDAEPEPEQVGLEAKRPCTRAPENWREEVRNTVPGPEQRGSEAKRPCNRTPENWIEELPNLNNLDWRPMHDPNISCSSVRHYASRCARDHYKFHV